MKQPERMRSHWISPLVLTGIVLVTAGASGLTGCRTAEQSRRGIAASRAQNGSPLAAQLDSMRMIQEKLVEVIDSLTDLAQADHDRIRALEADLGMLRSRLDGTGLPLPPPQNASAYGYPPPQPPPGVESPREESQQSRTIPPVTNPLLSRTPEMADRYDAALRLFRQNNFEGALSAFQRLDDEDPRGTYAPNYKYWEGECYYAMKSYEQALREFRNVVDEYPTSNKVEASEFKLGECYEKLGRASSARGAYQRLLSDFPNSEYRARASARINALKSAQ